MCHMMWKRFSFSTLTRSFSSAGDRNLNSFLLSNTQLIKSLPPFFGNLYFFGIDAGSKKSRRRSSSAGPHGIFWLCRWMFAAIVQMLIPRALRASRIGMNASTFHSTEEEEFLEPHPKPYVPRRRILFLWGGSRMTPQSGVCKRERLKFFSG